MHDLSILLVDDEPDVRQSLRKRLERAGHRVAEAADGVAAVEQARARRPDLAIVDIIMPEADGIETIVTLREQDPAIRIVAISGGGRTCRTDFLKHAQASGADAVLAKPFSTRSLLETIAHVTGAPAADPATADRSPT